MGIKITIKAAVGPEIFTLLPNKAAKYQRLLLYKAKFWGTPVAIIIPLTKGERLFLRLIQREDYFSFKLIFQKV